MAIPSKLLTQFNNPPLDQLVGHAWPLSAVQCVLLVHKVRANNAGALTKQRYLKKKLSKSESDSLKFLCWQFVYESRFFSATLSMNMKFIFFRTVKGHRPICINLNIPPRVPKKKGDRPTDEQWSDPTRFPFFLLKYLDTDVFPSNLEISLT